jgi:hypothetical protein
MIPRRVSVLAASLAFLAGPALAADPASSSGAPVSTASQSTDAKIAHWLDDGAKAPDAREPDGPGADDPAPEPDRKIHGEVGAAIGSGGYRSAYGVAVIPIGKSSSATVAVSTGHGPWPLVADGPWYAGPAGPGIMADCVCREAPDGSQLCRPARASSRIDAEMAQGACAPH